MNSKVFALLLIAAVGVLADEYNCAAEGKVCQNGGICHDTVALSATNPGSGGNGWATPMCICKAPYGGPDCSWTIRECKDSPCRNGGTCPPTTCRPGATMNQFDCFTCECAPGWTGAPAYTGGADNTGGICDWPLPVNDCSVNTCYNGGVCTNVHSPTVSSYSCACTAHWTGANCTVPLFNCTTTHPCQNGGTCNGIGTSCTCVTGYTGNVCQTRFCDTVTCQNGGTCFNGNPGSARCACTAQWTDPFCGTPRFCESNPCMNGGTCSNSAFPSTTGSCACLSNYGGTFCQIAPFCSSSPCQNGATCTNTGPGVGTCTNCPMGYAGTFCERVIPGCGTPNVDCAVAHTTTYNPNVPNNQQKTCPCRDQASCASSRWNTACTCKSGPDVFAFDCRCNSTYVPRCPSMFGTVPGQNVDMVCQNGATCVEHADGTYCSCRAGFWGPSCENYDNPCLNNPCNNGGKCSITTETGRRKNPDGNPVLSAFGNIALDDRFWAYQCNCKWPYYGNNCELQAPANPVVCTNNNCQNGGVCGPTAYSTNGWIRKTVGNFAVVGDIYNCACPANMTGVYCETPKITCLNTPNYCMNGGECVISNFFGNLANSKPGCICPCGYAGDRCEITAANADSTQLATLSGPRGGVGYRLDFCSAAPCQNGGTCITALNGQDFWCVCKSGYADRYCETKVRSSATGVVPSLIAVAAAVAVALALKN